MRPCFDFREEASRDISSSLAALHRLNRVTGVPGFVARTLAAPGQNITTTHWGWNDSPTMEGYRFVGNTSSDELTGTALSGSISTVLTVLSWICAGIYMCGALPSPVCA